MRYTLSVAMLTHPAAGRHPLPGGHVRIASALLADGHDVRLTDLQVYSCLPPCATVR